MLNLIFLPMWILSLPLNIIWNFIPDVLTWLLLAILALPFAITFLAIFLLIVLILFTIASSFGWMSTFVINDIWVNASVVGLALVAFDFTFAPAIGVVVTIYCFAGINGWNGNGCSNGISGIIPKFY